MFSKLQKVVKNQLARRSFSKSVNSQQVSEFGKLQKVLKTSKLVESSQNQ